MSNNDTSSLLSDVRHAYRLLFQFQTRILNLSKIIGNSFNLNYAGGYPQFSAAAPKNGKGSLDNWGWDWLNMYYYEFHFNGTQIGNLKINFSIFLLTDTGYFDCDPERKGSNAHSNKQLEVENFNSVKDSKSKLIFQLGYSDAWMTKPRDSDFTNALTRKGEWQLNDKNIIFKHYDLKEFADEQSTKSVINDFRKYALEHGFELAQIQVGN